MNSNYYFIKPYNNYKDLPPQESFGQIINETYMHPFNWNARTTRFSFWISTFVNLILASICSIILSYALGSDINPGLKWIDLVIITLIMIWCFLGSLGQTVRRLHDVNYSGYWYWAGLVSAGAYFIFYLALQPSVQRPVKWGGYLYVDEDKSSQAYYQRPYNEQDDIDTTPVPTIGQILKEHFFDCFNWNARSTRTSFWVGSAASYIATLGICLVIGICYFFNKRYYLRTNEVPDSMTIPFVILLLVSLIFLIWILIAQLSHLVRRLHDANFSGVWFFLYFIPYIGTILLDFLLFHPSVTKDNGWGGYLFKNKDKIRN